ncbi:nucleolar complex protein 3 homolog [Schistocerca gregaria]|uniref:nucleolar complex protein 3 homolog n=1 Tax=Schistocerca gregaria TaxID=7010 RepID=UPI00211DC28E|nr:nucleolar complex protein 3 homolog [Schistocerca gregaria]
MAVKKRPRVSKKSGPKKSSSAGNHMKFCRHQKTNKKAKPNIKSTFTRSAKCNDNGEPAELNQEDVQYYEDRGEYVQLISDFDINSLAGPNKKKLLAMPRSYEQESGSRQWTDSVDNLESDKRKKKLPIKIDGYIKPIYVEEDKDEEKKSASSSQLECATQRKQKKRTYSSKAEPSNEELGVAEYKDTPGNESDMSDLSVSAKSKKRKESQLFEEDDDMKELYIMADRQKKIQDIKEKIAQYATAIVANPSENLELLNVLKKYCTSHDATISNLANLSLLAIYHDIIPSYRVITNDNAANLSKEMKEVRSYELAMLKCYQNYLFYQISFLRQNLRYLELNGGKSTRVNLHNLKSIRSKIDISVKVLGSLLEKHYYFNLTSNIITMALELINSPDQKISDTMMGYVSSVLRQDTQFIISLQIVRAVSQFVKKKRRCNGKVLDILLCLQLTTTFKEGTDIFSSAPAKRKKHLSIKERKELKKQKEIDKKMKCLQSSQRKEDISNLQTEILKTMFLLYFEILKTKKHVLLPNVLEGMAHFSHLINIELLLDIIEILRTLFQDKKLPLVSRLYTVVTAFQAIKLQGDTLKVDLRDYYTYLYQLIEPVVCSTPQCRVLMPILLRALEMMFLNQKLYALERVTAYSKRLINASLYCDHQSALALLALVGIILKKYPKTQLLLDSEYSGSGVYSPYTKDPDHCNASASNTWEFFLLSNHYHPSVSELANSVFQLEYESSQELLAIFHHFDFFRNGFLPPMTPPRPHTFEKIISRSQKNEAECKNYFIRPSAAYPKSDFMAQSEELSNQINLDQYDPTVFQPFFEGMKPLV